MYSLIPPAFPANIFLWLQKKVLKHEMNVSHKIRNSQSNPEPQPGEEGYNGTRL